MASTLQTANFYLKKDDLLPEIEVILRGIDGKPLNLVGVTVVFRMCDTAGAVKVSAAATITDAANGVVKYTWVTGDTDTAALFNAVFKATFPAAKPITFPTIGFITIRIEDNC